MKVIYSVSFDLPDNLSEAEVKQAIEDKRRYLEEDVRVRFHNNDLRVKVKVK